MVAPVLDEFQFDLDGYVWGHGLPIFVDPEGFDPGDPDNITQDGVNPITGARMFGRDMQSAGQWTWQCHVDGDDVESALEYAALMGSKWRDEKWLTSIAQLRYSLAGRTRCVYGRPRRFSFKPNNGLLSGYLPPMASFDLVDSKYYDDDEQFVDMQIVPAVVGGFEVPFEAPILVSLQVPTVQPGLVVIGGDAKTSPVVEFTGPLTNGSVVIDTLTYGFTGTLPADAQLIIDPRPWAQAVTRIGNTTGVALSRDTRLTRSLVGPGNYQALFRGTDPSGTARCRVSWRNAYSTL